MNPWSRVLFLVVLAAPVLFALILLIISVVRGGN